MSRKKFFSIVIFTTMFLIFYINIYPQLIDYLTKRYLSRYYESQTKINQSDITLTKPFNRDEINEFDFQSYCFRKTNNWKWKPLSIIYNSLIDQYDYFDSHLNVIIDNLAKNKMKITIQNIKNFKIEFNQRTR
jgi:hypothetical protein